MPYNTIEKRINALGYCCPRIFFNILKNTPHQEVADYLMCAKVSVRKWRQKHKRGELLCQTSPTCKCFSVALGQCPAKARAPSAGTDPVPNAELPGEIL